MVDTLAADEKSRTDFMKACLAKLGLKINQETTTVPSLSSLHLSALDPEDTAKITSSLQEVIVNEDGQELLKDENDTFLIRKPGTWNMDQLEENLPETAEEKTVEKSGDSNDGIIDYNAIVKRLVIHNEFPSSKTTPYFNHHAFYSNLSNYRSQSKEDLLEFGSQILYAEVITSTNTILEKYVQLSPSVSSLLLTYARNTQLLRRLPNGFTATATVQVAGRGRGSNVWVSPAGSLMFSTVIRHPMEKMQSAPVVFIQYLAAMAVVKGIKSYDKGYENMPVKLKWPNDIC